MDSPTSTSSFGERYKLTVNGQPVTPAHPSRVKLRKENTATLKLVDAGPVSAELYVNGRLAERRPSGAPGTVSWRWMSDGAERYTLRLRLGDGEYLFEVSGDGSPEEDYLTAMLGEIEEFSLDLVFSKHGDEIKRRQRAWFDHLSGHWEQLEPVIEMIARAPHHRLSKRRVKKLIQEVDRVDVNTITSILTGEGERVNIKGGAPALRKLLESVPLRVEVEENYRDYDVAENRLLKGHLDALLAHIDDLARVSAQRDRFLRRMLKLREGEETVETAREFLANHDLATSAEALRKRISARCHDPRLAFLEEVKLPSPAQGETPLLEAYPHYSRFQQLHASYNEEAPPPLPRLALDRDAGRDELYLRWCTFKILEAAVELGYSLREERLTRMEDQRVAVEVPRGLVSTLAKEGSRLELLHDRVYPNEPPYGSYSAPKRVPLALEVFGEDEVPRIVVFTPRYDPDYTEEKFEAGDLDRLHALRDAIVDLRTGGREKLVVGGCVLHPANLRSVQYDVLYAVPLRPGARKDRLVEVLGELLG